MKGPFEIVLPVSLERGAACNTAWAAERAAASAFPASTFFLILCLCLYLHEYDKGKRAKEQRSTSKGAHPITNGAYNHKHMRTTTKVHEFTSDICGAFSRWLLLHLRQLKTSCSTRGNYDLLLYSRQINKMSCSTPPVACLLLYSRQLRPRPTSNSHYPIPPSCTPPSCTPPFLPLSPLLPRSLAVAVARSLLLRLAL